MEEQLAVITGLWTAPDGEAFSFDGKFYSVADSPALPKPVQRPRPPVIIGGGGQKRTPRLAAAYADEYNAGFDTVAGTKAAFDRVRAAVEAALRRGTSFGFSHPAEAELAELVVEMIPSVEMVRLVNSGNEATLAAVRQGRAATSRGLILKVEGCYHRHARTCL